MMMVVVRMVMMVMVVMSASFSIFKIYRTMLLTAMLSLGLQFQRCMMDAMLCQLLTHAFLNFVRIAAGHHVHGGVIAIAVHAPNVDMMCVNHTLNANDMLPNFAHVDPARGFFKK